MAIRSNSYGSVAGVEAVTRQYAGSAYTTSTRPKLAEVEKFIDRVSGILNVLLAKAGFSISVTQADARLALDDFVVYWATMYCHSANRAGPFSPERREVRGELSFSAILKEAEAFIKGNALGFERLGATREYKQADGLYAGGISVDEKDSFEDDTDRELPSFARGMQRPSEISQRRKLSAESYP